VRIYWCCVAFIQRPCSMTWLEEEHEADEKD
jgi:hypothetical protein